MPHLPSVSKQQDVGYGADGDIDVNLLGLISSRYTFTLH